MYPSHPLDGQSPPTPLLAAAVASRSPGQTSTFGLSGALSRSRRRSPIIANCCASGARRCHCRRSRWPTNRWPTRHSHRPWGSSRRCRLRAACATIGRRAIDASWRATRRDAAGKETGRMRNRAAELTANGKRQQQQQQQSSSSLALMPIVSCNIHRILDYILAVYCRVCRRSLSSPLSDPTEVVIYHTHVQLSSYSVIGCQYIAVKRRRT